MNKRKKILIIIVSIFGAIILVAVAAWIYLAVTIRPPEVPNIPIARPPASNADNTDDNETDSKNPYDAPIVQQYEERRPDFFTFVIFGLTEGLNANTIMVAAYDAAAQEAFLISIPRDTRVDVPRNSQKIVSAYPIGRMGGQGHAGGAQRMRYEVSTLVGFLPDFYISINYEAFVQLVDAVGGVEIYVPFHMYYNDPYQDLHIDLPAGRRLLDGQEALLFSRYRTGTAGVSPTISDYQRILHQQEVLSALIDRLLTPASILRIPEFISIFNEHFNSDLSGGELLWFANQARQIGGIETLNLYTLPMAGTSGPPRWYELADEAGILELVNRTVNPLIRDITAEDVRIIN